MNYRHAYHAGNFADVVKHAALSRLVEYLKLKDKAFRVVDTHAGTGLYDLSSEEAQKTGEWQGGIGRLLDAELSLEADALLSPYLAAVKAANPESGVKQYPGSPLIVRHLMRPQDRLSAIELHPKDFQRLKARFAGDFQVRTIELDGWLALGAHLPPKEKRGLVLIDPPYEAQEAEYRVIEKALKAALERWPTGVYAVWYPIKLRSQVQPFHRWLQHCSARRVLRAELLVHPDDSPLRLNGSGMVILNAPWKLDEALRDSLRVMAPMLSQERPAQWRLDWLVEDSAS